MSAEKQAMSRQHELLHAAFDDDRAAAETAEGAAVEQDHECHPGRRPIGWLGRIAEPRRRIGELHDHDPDHETPAEEDQTEAKQAEEETDRRGLGLLVRGRGVGKWL